jgi:hypothetical protein|tara:strand:- start:1202 stop:2176 length:975 start_codon:yes stop_codon:yes gene_type:complete
MTVITSGYGRNTWNSGAWNRSVVDRSVTVTGVSLSTTVRSVAVTIPGTAFVTNAGISLSLRNVTTAANANVSVTRANIGFSLRSAIVEVIKTHNVTGVALVTTLRSSTITSSPKVIPSQVIGSFSLGTPFIKAGIDVDVTGVTSEFDTGNESSQAGANPVIYNGGKTFKVTVVNVGGANKYFIDGRQQYGLNLVKGRGLYTFDQSDSSNDGHPLRFYLDAARSTLFSTNVYTEGTPGNAGAYTSIFVVNSGPTTLYYQCSAHANMGGKANFQPVIRTRVISPNINGDGNLVLTGVSARFRTHIRGIWTPKVFAGGSEIWKAKKI